MKRNRPIYLDHAAATPIDKAVAAAMRPYWRTRFYNPSSLYAPARAVRQALESARGSVANVLGAKAAEIIFTAGATESINLALAGVVRASAGNVVVSAIEHEAVVAAAEAHAPAVRFCPVSPQGQLDLKKLAQLIDEETVLVSVIYASNEIGAIQPLAEIAKLVAKKRQSRPGNGRPLYFHSDASQAANYLPLAVDRLGVDLMTLNGAKIYGPKQSGCLYVKAGVKLAPLVYGGGQERGLRSGTESVALGVGFARALEQVQAAREEESARVAALRARLLAGLERALPDISLNGDIKRRLPNNLNLSIPGVDGETLLHHLDAAGILAATGSACSANKAAPSSVLAALNLEADAIKGSLRLSLGRLNTERDIRRAVKIIPQVVAEVRTLAAVSDGS